MFIFLKDLVVIGVSIITAFLVSVGIVSEEAVAPDVTPPGVVVEEGEEEGVSEDVMATDTAESPPETPPEVPEEEAPAPEPIEQPVVDDLEQSLQEALEALARIQAEEEAQTSQPSLNETVRASVVNILCTITSGGPLTPISASGVIIDPRGIILTNAHVAQYYLLENYPAPGFVECIIRTGSPATPAYTSALLYLPPSWIIKNAQKIDDEQPTGNGEHDYALVQITGAVGGGALPSSFPHLPVALAAPDEDDPILLAGYPAGFLGGATIQQDLYAASANVTVQELYTFERSTVDLFSLGGSIVAQQGSSGGAAARNDGALVGLIVTASSAPNTANRDLRALSTEYIIRDFEKERGIPLSTYLSGNIAQERTLFTLNTAPTLSAMLISVLEQ